MALTQVTSGLLDNSTQTYGMKNRIINGDMRIDQRNAGASVTTSTLGATTYTLDRWSYFNNSSESKFTIQQNAGSVTPPVGFTNYLGITSTSAYSVSANEILAINQRIEGFNTADLAWGTSDAKTITLSFWVRSSLTGTFGGTLKNGVNNRTYAYTYIISAANTWEYKTITIPGDTTGTWSTSNSAGFNLNFSMGVGSTYQTTAGAWTAGNYSSPTGVTSVVGTSGATFYLTGVQLEKGATATSFDYRPFGTELQLCQRYYAKLGYKSGAFIGSGNTYAGGLGAVYVKYPVTMRANPTASFSNLTGGDGYNYGRAVASLGSSQIGPDSAQIALNVSPADMVASRVFVLYPAADTGYLDFSAEL